MMKKIGKKLFFNCKRIARFLISYFLIILIHNIDMVKFSKQISSKAKAQLISDAFSLAQSNQLSPVIPLQLSAFLSEETDYLPWKVFLSRIKFYTDHLESKTVNVFLNRYLIRLVGLYNKKLGWSENKNESWTDRYFFEFKIMHPRLLFYSNISLL